MNEIATAPAAGPSPMLAARPANAEPTPAGDDFATVLDGATGRDGLRSHEDDEALSEDHPVDTLGPPPLAKAILAHLSLDGSESQITPVNPQAGRSLTAAEVVDRSAASDARMNARPEIDRIPQRSVGRPTILAIALETHRTSSASTRIGATQADPEGLPREGRAATPHTRPAPLAVEAASHHANSPDREAVSASSTQTPLPSETVLHGPDLSLIADAVCSAADELDAQAPLQSAPRIVDLTSSPYRPAGMVRRLHVEVRLDNGDGIGVRLALDDDGLGIRLDCRNETMAASLRNQSDRLIEAIESGGYKVTELRLEIATGSTPQTGDGSSRGYGAADTGGRGDRPFDDGRAQPRARALSEIIDEPPATDDAVASRKQPGAGIYV